jgi:hypothetical protein
MTARQIVRRSARALLLVALAAVPAAAADFGTLTKDEEPTVALAHAVACTPRYDTVGFGKPELVVLLSDRALDADAVRSGIDCDAHAFEQAVARGDGALVSLAFAAGPKLARVSIYGVGFTLGNDRCEACASTFAWAGDRVKGTVSTTRPLELNDSRLSLAVTFDLPKPGAPAPGTPLPAGGGEPGKALLAWVEAYRQGDFATLERVLPPGKAADQWGYYEDPKERAEAIRQDGNLEPKSAKVLSGVRLGDYALLTVEVPPLWGEGRQKALVGLSLVDGSWRVDDLRRDLAGTMFAK